jgi:hypothetical protein
VATGDRCLVVSRGKVEVRAELRSRARENIDVGVFRLG